MRALAVYDNTLTLLSDAPQPEPQPGEVLIRTRLAGICNTDLEIVRGYFGYQGILGHEFVGEVVAGPPEWLGKRVVGEINIACGTCDLCLAGIPSQCRRRSTLGIAAYAGVFAEYFCLPVANLYAVPDEVTDTQAVFVEPLAAALQVLETSWIRPSDRVVLIGAGKLGLLTAQVLRLIGCDLTVITRHERQERLLSRWGIAAARVEDTPPAQADVVVDCTGRAEGFADSLRLLRPRGTLVLKSTYHGLPTADLTRVVVDEVRVVGSRCGPFAAALRLLKVGLVDVESLIERRFSLAEGLLAFEVATQPGTLKVLLAG